MYSQNGTAVVSLEIPTSYWKLASVSEFFVIGFGSKNLDPRADCGLPTIFIYKVIRAYGEPGRKEGTDLAMAYRGMCVQI